MPERDGYIPGVPCWVDSTQPDPEAVLDFYSGMFGWELENLMPAGSPAKYYAGRLHGGDVAAIASASAGAPPSAEWNTYIWVDSADDAAAKVRKAGGKVIMEPYDVPGAGRMAILADPEGTAFRVWQAKEHKGSRVVNEHGAVNFNNLATRDLERAKAFYGAVFGWKILEMPGTLFWILPGYADHLEETTPGLRENVKSMGVPEEFVDVVATIQRIDATDTSTSNRWSVTFGVDDAEAIAKLATKLGGKVISGPTDAPWTRMVEIQDPRGATFIAGQFVPENREVSA